MQFHRVRDSGHFSANWLSELPKLFSMSVSGSRHSVIHQLKSILCHTQLFICNFIMNAVELANSCRLPLVVSTSTNSKQVVQQFYCKLTESIIHSCASDWFITIREFKLNGTDNTINTHTTINLSLSQLYHTVHTCCKQKCVFIKSITTASNLSYEMAAQPVCVLFYLLLAGGVVSGFTPVTYPVSSECGQYDKLQDQHLMETLGQIQQQLDCHPSMNISCQEILHCFPSAPSGYYQIRVSNGSLVQVYCDMEGTNCGGEGGWTRVAHVNMSQSGATCPQGLTQTTLSGLTLCGRNGPPGCQSTVFSTLGLIYSQVCGQLRGYQRGAPDAFRSYYLNSSQTIDSVYVTASRKTDQIAQIIELRY